MTKKFLSENKELMQEWDWEANADLDPSQLLCGSGKKAWWICSKGHKYQQTIEKRTRRGFSCPYCSGHKAWKGFNDFEIMYPEIAKEWHSTRNGELKPCDVTYGSGKRVWWECPVGHEYQAVVRERGSGGTNCPICNLRKSTSFPEQAILYYVKKLWPNSLNKYKDCFNNSMEFDVYIPELKVAIEYDGTRWHRTASEYKRELKKYEFCKKNEIYLIRVKEHSRQQWNDTSDEVYYLPKTNKKNYYELERIIFHLLGTIRGLKPPLGDVNIEKDKNEILNYLSTIDNSLAEMRPDIVAKWHSTKNGNLTPDMFSIGSNEVVWWKCPDCGKEWKTSINSMTSSRYGCSVCGSTKRGKEFTKLCVKQRGSLAETMPHLIDEWHPTKNGTLTPYDITAGRFKPVWWLCIKCGHEWEASPNNRKKGVGCPCCSGRVPKKGSNDLETLYPNITKEWDIEKNFPLKPSDVHPGSGKKVWWKCSKCGHLWLKEIRQMLKYNKCPSCSKKQKD